LKIITKTFQACSYTVNKLFKKIVEYEKRKISVLWIIPLTHELTDEPFRPRLFEKYIHSLYFGRVYYWYPNSGTLLQPIHFGPAKRWIEESSWFDPDLKEERVEGGFWLSYRTIKKPNFGAPANIPLDFKPETRKSFQPKNVKKAIPECSIFKDKNLNWWKKEEYKKLEEQFTVIKEKVPGTINSYTYWDEYDDEFYEEDRF